MLPDENNPTPLVELKKLPEEFKFKHTRFFAKLEWFCPFGSIKDRVAANMIFDGISKKVINDKVDNLVEPTSGNTGLGLAMMSN